MSQKTFQNITSSSVSHPSFRQNGTRQPRLPSELLGAILEPFAGKSGKRDLLNAALAFEALRNESQRILFRSVVIPEGITERRSLKNLIRQCAFFSAIVNAPERLGPYVQTVASEYLTTAPVELNLHSKESISAHGQDSYRQATMRLYNLTFLAFSHLIHLKHLTFTSLNMGHDWRKNTSIRLLRSCTFSLNSLSWHRPQDLPILASDFFPHQQSIQSFYMRGDFSNDVMIPSDVLPKLKLLYASSHLLLALLPGRHVKSVTWAESTGEPDALIESVSELLTGVEYLAISHNQTLQNVPVSRNLLSVKVLCLKTYDRANWVENMSTLKDMKTLRKLILLTPTRIVQQGDYDIWVSSIKRIAKRAFEFCPRLTNAYIQDASDGDAYFQFMRRTSTTNELRINRIEKTQMLEHFAPWIPHGLMDVVHMHAFL